MPLFGTDGVRGLANADLSAALALDLSIAAASALAPRVAGPSRPRAVVGRDTRASGEFLEAAVVAGLASAGVDVEVVGVVPTPATAWLTAHTGAAMGVMITASHNPMPDNGIKFFAAGGLKLSDDAEAAIEAAYERVGELARPTGADVGRVTRHDTAAEEYAAHLAGTIGTSLAGLRVVLDCAEGAAYDVGPRAFALAGADVVAIHVSPDGTNINAACGSTHLDRLQAAVLEHGADVGFAFDGDADRCLAVDAAGQIVDGDQLLAILAGAMQAAGALVEQTVVATVMSNLGFLQAMDAAGITVVRTAVGDRYVLEELTARGLALGGEQSGHVILPQFATTGDGVLAALQVASRIADTGSSLAQLAAVMTRLPQVLVNVGGVDKAAAEADPVLAAAVTEAEAELGDSGRVLLRPSGTEPLVRVMVEAPTASQAQLVADRLADVVRTRCSL